MTHPTPRPVRFARAAEKHSALAARLAREVEGEVRFDAATRGRYATDASIYQVMPVGVVVPRTGEAAIIAMQIAAEARVAILPRGAGTSQCGQTVGEALVIDDSKHLDRLLDLDVAARRAVVEPGIVLDSLNAMLKPHGLWYPVDVSTSAQATLGGMTGNNSCGSRSLAYGNMVDRVVAIDAWLPTGIRGRFDAAPTDPAIIEIARKAAALYARERDEIVARTPKTARNVAGYNLSSLEPRAPVPFPNLASLLVGSEGTLAWFERVHIELAELPKHKALGVAHFPRFHDAMDAAQHIVKLGPCAVELVDRTMLDLALSNAAFAPVIRRFVKGEPQAVLLVEFAGPDRDTQLAGVRRLDELMGSLGFPGSVVPVAEAGEQKSLWDVRKAGLNIMMSMKGDGKPVSFIEDCAVPLEHLAEYTSALTEVFRKHGTEGTWYAHASVGCLHVRPVLNMKGDGAIRMRAIAEEAADLVRRYKGAYSGEHGDGLVRSEWIAPFFGPRLTACLAEVKSWFDPAGVMNPGQDREIPRARTNRLLMRYGPHYEQPAAQSVLDWSAWGGFSGAVEMCNNNGHCRKFDAGTMCPSYRATRDERDLTRGRANTLRLALSNQLGPQDEAEEAVREALELCVSCKGCKSDCPTGVDMARMKVEFLARYKRRHGFTIRDRLVAHLPRDAPWAARLQPLASLVLKLPGANAVVEALGFDRRRPLPGVAQVRVDVAARRGGRGPRRGALRGHVQQLARAREPRRGGARLGGDGTSRASRAWRWRTAVVLRAHLPHRGNGRRSTRRGAAHDRGPRARDRGRHTHRGPRAFVRLHVPRRISGDVPRRCARCAPVAHRARGRIPGPGDPGRPRRPALEAARAARDPRARALPPEGVRHVRRHARDAARDSGREGGSHRVWLLRHGGCLRPREGPLRRVDEDGRVGAPALGARRARHGIHRRGRRELPPADLRRHRPPRGPSHPARGRSAVNAAAAPQLLDALAYALAFEPTAEAAGNLTVGRGKLGDVPVRVGIIENKIASGSLGSLECQRLAALFAVAARERSPLVIHLDSAGARVSEGLKALGAFRALYRAGLEAALGGMRIAVTLGRNCFGGSSMLAYLAARRLLQESTQLAMSGPSVIATANGVDAMDEMFRAMAEASMSATARATTSPANRVWKPGDDVAACLAEALVPAPDPVGALRMRHEELGRRLPKSGGPRPMEALRRRDLEKIYAQGYEAREKRRIPRGQGDE